MASTALRARAVSLALVFVLRNAFEHSILVGPAATTRHRLRAGLLKMSRKLNLVAAPPHSRRPRHRSAKREDALLLIGVLAFPVTGTRRRLLACTVSQ